MNPKTVSGNYETKMETRWSKSSLKYGPQSPQCSDSVLIYYLGCNKLEKYTHDSVPFISMLYYFNSLFRRKLFLGL